MSGDWCWLFFLHVTPTKAVASVEEQFKRLLSSPLLSPPLLFFSFALSQELMGGTLSLRMPPAAFKALWVSVSIGRLVHHRADLWRAPSHRCGRIPPGSYAQIYKVYTLTRPGGAWRRRDSWRESEGDWGEGRKEEADMGAKVRYGGQGTKHGATGSHGRSW